MQFPITCLAKLDIGLAGLLRLLLECMQYMNPIAPTNYVENSERATLILDSNFPNTAAYTGERSAMQRLFAQLQ